MFHPFPHTTPECLNPKNLPRWSPGIKLHRVWLRRQLRRKHGPIWVFQDDVFCSWSGSAAYYPFSWMNLFSKFLPPFLNLRQNRFILVYVHVTRQQPDYSTYIVRHNRHVSFAHGYIHGRRRTQWPTSCSSLWSQISGLQRLQGMRKMTYACVRYYFIII